MAITKASRPPRGPADRPGELSPFDRSRASVEFVGHAAYLLTQVLAWPGLELAQFTNGIGQSCTPPFLYNSETSPSERLGTSFLRGFVC